MPALAEEQVMPVALTGMGRFCHEAVAVDPVSGVIYQTEDPGSKISMAGFYRFLPRDVAQLAQGGTLQMLAIQDHPRYDARRGQSVGRVLPVSWVNIHEPDTAEAEINPSAVFAQGLARGGAAFIRLEGCWFDRGACYFSSTSGGDAGLGQIWEYRPDGADTGSLQLIFESTSSVELNHPDNITLSPRGGMLICEDAKFKDPAGRQYLRGLTMTGGIFDFARNLMSQQEWTGACFSPDGETLFVNIQGTNRGPDDASGVLGMSFAIWGPWQKGSL